MNFLNFSERSKHKHFSTNYYSEEYLQTHQSRDGISIFKWYSKLIIITPLLQQMQMTELERSLNCEILPWVACEVYKA